MFFSKKQLNQTNSVEEQVNGKKLQQLWNNLNILLWGLRNTTAFTMLQRLLSPLDSFHASGLFPFLASRNVQALRESLVRLDDDHDLPRVLFCNATWVLYDRDLTLCPHDVGPSSHVPLKQQQNHAHALPTSHLSAEALAEERANALTARHVKDHQWAIIKHTNDHFQVVQGYVSKAGRGNHSNRTIVMRGCESQQQEEEERRNAGGYFLSEWQNQPQLKRQNKSQYQPHLDTHGGRYASSSGFARTEMLHFLNGVGSFAAATADAMEAAPSGGGGGGGTSNASGSTPTAAVQQTQRGFDSALFKSLFGVFERSSLGRLYSPGFSFRELHDSSIQGAGERHMGDKIEQDMDANE
jgi:hypothetical protein